MSKITDEFITVYGHKHKERANDNYQFSVYIFADEINPFTKKFVRKVVIPPPNFKGSDLIYQQVINPTKYGIIPRDESSNVSLGRHVLGRTDSNFISVSRRLLGSPRFSGQRFWIDKKKVLLSGAKIYDVQAINQDVDRVVEKMKKGDKEFKKTGNYSTKTLHYLKEAERIKYLSYNIDKESVVQGRIPPEAVKNFSTMITTRGLQVVSAFGIVMTTSNIENAVEKSIKQKSIQPVTAQVVREIGGWGGAAVGARAGFILGASLGVETGPFVPLAGAIGAGIGGAIGYVGVDNILQYFNWGF